MSFKTIFENTCRSVSKTLSTPKAENIATIIGGVGGLAAVAAQYLTGTQTAPGVLGSAALPFAAAYANNTLANITGKIGKLSQDDQKDINQQWKEDDALTAKINQENFEAKGTFSELAQVGKAVGITELLSPNNPSI